MEPVRIAGIGMTPFATHEGRTGRDLFVDAARAAIADSVIEPEAIDELVYGNFIGELAEQQGHQGALMADTVGVTGPATRVECACASGGAAIREAIKTIRSELADVVLVGGMERMSHLDTDCATSALGTAADNVFESRTGLTFPGAYALLARQYLETHGGTREDLAEIAVKNHANAVGNDIAHLQHQITVEDVLEAPMIADPIGLYDACPISDGAAAILLVSDRYARQRRLDSTVHITGVGQASDVLSIQHRLDRTLTPATTRAAKQAFEEANIETTDVDILEVHDCFTIAEVLALEALGFYDQGTAITAAADGDTRRDGELPVNISGGLKAKGHPVGATGVGQVVELTKLLRGEHPNSNYLSDPSIGVAHNAGGTVASAVVHVLEVI